jgi:N-acetylglucosamine-6-phosphate deacetylase
MIIKDCAVYNADPKQGLSDIRVLNGKISEIGKNLSSEGETIIDASGKTVIPGIIEVHIQGAGGADILDGTEEALIKMAKTLARLGTTSYLGTTVVKPKENNAHLRFARKYVNKKTGGAYLLGFHLEGPFINPKKKGGLDPNSIYDSSPEKLDEIYEVLGDTLKMMTIAPEMPWNHEAIKSLREHNVIASIAHSDATYDEAKKGIEVGINHVTHIFNAMPSLLHRTPGPIAAIFENKTITAQIIGDGHHLHPSIVKTIYRMIGGDRCICITDGMQAMGLPEGKYVYNGKEYTSKDGAAKYDDGTLIGSTMSLLNIAFKFQQFTGCTFETAINTVTINPAKLLGIEKQKGHIASGFDADIVIIDKDNSVFTTIIDGEVVYKK